MENTKMIIYQTEDGKTKIETRLEDETVWLTQAQMAELFQKNRVTITEHIRNIFKESELDENSVCRKFRHTATDGKEYETQFYNLDVIISVGYRVKSMQGTKFRKWATARLKEYIVKGFTINDDLLKQAGGGNYFEELLARIRDIRSSEKIFWRKVLDIYATSIDYDAKAEISIQFFQTVQNKMHWAAHGNTAAEIIYQRIDANKLNLGLTNFKGLKPTKQETEIAKNYLNKEELNILNRLVTTYLELAEIQATNQIPMYMKNWVESLDYFIKMAGKEVLQNTGTISHLQATEKTNKEYKKFREIHKNELSEVEKQFIDHLETETKKIGILKKKKQ